MLNIHHGWFSNWKNIKKKINQYKQLDPDNIEERRSKLASLQELIETWKTKNLENEDQRLIDIRVQLPQLEALIQTELRETDKKWLDDVYYGGKVQDVSKIPIPKELTQGIHNRMDDDAKARQLFENLNNFRFEYTGRFLGGRAAFEAHQGDCQTLTGMFTEVAQSLGIEVEPGELRGKHLVPGGPIHGRDDQSNTEDGGYWFFQEHYWVVVNGKPYDVLFMVAPPPNAILASGEGQFKGVKYQIFNGGLCLIEPGQDALNVQIQGQGRVFRTVRAAKAFIAENT